MTPSLTNLTPLQHYASISRRALDVEDYIDIVRRHVTWILAPAFAGLVIACVVAFFLPDVYASYAVMRITPSQISEGLVPSTVNQQMADQISQMQQEILSRNSLSELIQRPALDLYKKERAAGTIEDVTERMRSAVHINVYNTSAGAHPGTAFTIAFAYPDRFKAQAVVQALMGRFTESIVNVQTNLSKETLTFLKDEITQAKAEMNRLDNEITQYRIQNAGHLPEELQVNMQALNGLQAQLNGVNDALNRISEEKMTLETNLNTLRTQRDTVNSMAVVTQETYANRALTERLAQLNGEIGGLEAHLLQLQSVYTEKWPYVKDAKRQIEIKKKERDYLQAKADEEAQKPKPAPKTYTNPMMIEHLNDIQGTIDMVQTQLRLKETEKLERLKQLDQINKTMATYDSRIALIPENQQKFASLAREHDLAQQTYLELQRKQTLASTFDDVGKHSSGEKLEVLDAASLPESPALPNRPMDIGIGIGVGLGLGVLLTGVKEMKDTSLKNLKDVRAYTNLPILSSIPLLENDLLVRRKRRLAYVGWSAAVILGMVLMCSSMYYHYFLKTT